MSKKMVSARLESSTVTKLDKLVKHLDARQASLAEVHGFIHKEASRADVIELLITQHFLRMSKEGYDL